MKSLFILVSLLTVFNVFAQEKVKCEIILDPDQAPTVVVFDSATQVSTVPILTFTSANGFNLKLNAYRKNGKYLIAAEAVNAQGVNNYGRAVSEKMPLTLHLAYLNENKDGDYFIIECRKL